jgi:hypothetical protein
LWKGTIKKTCNFLQAQLRQHAMDNDVHRLGSSQYTAQEAIAYMAIAS